MDDEFDGRRVLLERHEPSGVFRATTTQKETEISETYSDDSSAVIGSVISEGEEIMWESATIEDLIKDLTKVGFLEKDVLKIARHAENPPKPAE